MTAIDTATQPYVVLRTEIEGLKPFIRGKVRDVYELDSQLLIVATDRLSAYDVVLPTGIPAKGAVLNQLSAFWFEQLKGVCPNHCVSIDADEIAAAVERCGGKADRKVLAGRSMLVRRAQALPVECVVRGYLEGSAWKEYQRSRSICGISLPEGLTQGSRLPEPIFTPTTKAHTGHDEALTHEEMGRMLDSALMQQLIDMSLATFSAAGAYALERGIIIADTKFEFGLLDGRPVMIDECLTPDSSRFWDAEAYRPGQPQNSLDKQFVRDYLDQSGWNHEPPAPELPPDVVRQTSDRYREIFRRLTRGELT